MTSTTLLFVRHGETEANRARRIQGQDDSPLTERGTADSKQLATTLLKAGLDPVRMVVYCSPLTRARETLRRIRTHLDLSGDVAYDPRLMEIDFGIYTGQPVDQVLPVIGRHKQETALPYPGGESGDDLKQRVVSFVDDAKTRHGNGQVLVVTHFGVIETVIGHYTAPQDIPIRPDHGRVYRIVLMNPGGRLEVF
ncbi:MAG: histidine phosphatase family protein [Leptospirillia bacterium]